ncbi:MAG: Hpt domain-containing protein [Flavobacteriales bacterium]
MHYTDLSILNGLFKGDQARVAEWIDLYLEEAPGYYQRVEDALIVGDTKAMAFAVHELRPQAHYLGAPRLLELLLLIGDLAAEEGTTACSGMVGELVEMGHRIEEELREHERPAWS